MFNRLSSLYTQYRVLSVEVQWHGSNTMGYRGFTSAPALMWISPEGSSTSLPANIQEFARSTNGAVEAYPSMRVTKKQSYVKWLVENEDHPYLLTLDQSGARELYSEVNMPALAFWKIFTPSESFATDMVLGHFVTRVHYEFRGARVNTAAPVLAINRVTA